MSIYIFHIQSPVKYGIPYSATVVMASGANKYDSLMYKYY